MKSTRDNTGPRQTERNRLVEELRCMKDNMIDTHKMFCEGDIDANALYACLVCIQVAIEHTKKAAFLLYDGS